MGCRRAPLGEPQLFGVIIGHAFVEVAVVVDEAFKAVGPVAGDPIDHVAAVGGAEGADIVTIHPGVGF